MHTSDTGSQHIPMSELAATFLELRDVVLAQWSARVTAEIPSATRLGEPILINTLPTLYDNIAESLAVGSPRPFATTGTNLASAHGRERANMTDYGPHDLIHELQIFREVLFAVAAARHLPLSKRDAEVIGHSIEEAARESISGYNAVNKETSEAFIASLSHDLRNPLHVANASAQLIQLIQLKTSDPGILTLAKRICLKIAETDAMIQTLLDAAVLKGKMKLKLHIVRFDIMALIEEVCADLPLFGQHVSVEGEKIEGYWCRVSLKRVLENLVSNARKYGDASQPLTVRVDRVDAGCCSPSTTRAGRFRRPRWNGSSIVSNGSRTSRSKAGGWACPTSVTSPKATAAVSSSTVRKDGERRSRSACPSTPAPSPLHRAGRQAQLAGAIPGRPLPACAMIELSMPMSIGLTR